jgi:hypothetical protein
VHYGDVLVTEHGRVAPCVGAATRAYEPHCLHAHRLVFTGAPSIDFGAFFPGAELSAASTFERLAAAGLPPGQYLYAEDAASRCWVMIVDRPFPRQFFRRVIAAAVGEIETADWHRHPRRDVIEAASARLMAPSDKLTLASVHG